MARVIETIIAVLVIIIVLVLVMHRIMNPPHSSYQALCLNNLKQINLGMHIYADEHDGLLPADLHSLYESTYVKDWKVFICPKREKKEHSEFIEAKKIDYTFVSDVNLVTSPPTILIYCSSDIHRHGRVPAGLSDGSVMRYDANDFKPILKDLEINHILKKP